MKKELKSVYKNAVSQNNKYDAAFKLQKYFFEIEKNPEKFEYWGNICISLDKTRPEALYLLVKYFRETCQYYKAMHYYLIANDANFQDEIKNLFLYEYTIFIYYIDKDRKVGLNKCLEYLNSSISSQHLFENVFNNLEYYIQPVKSIDKPFSYNFGDYGEFNPSSPSIAIVGDKIIMNVRYKQYKISPQGAYYSNEIQGGRMIVRTDNQYCLVDHDFKPITPLNMMPTVLDDLQVVDVDIKGLEDLRLFTFKDKVYYLATSREYSVPTGNYKMVMGEYDYQNLKMDNNKVLESPFNRECEKNWLPIVKYIPEGSEENTFKQDRLNFIYNYHPLQIGHLDENNKLIITKMVETPNIFSKFRGSSNTFFKDGFYYFLVHLVKYTSPRKYYHSLVVLDHNYNLVKYSSPFVFLSMSIEYCLSLNLEDDVFTFIFSQWDDKPTMIRVKNENLDWHLT
jgi:hypothetical protein